MPARIPAIALWCLLAACIVRLWLMPLPSSFWVDEMETAFIVQHGLSDPSLQVAPQMTATIYYALPAAANRWFGLSEVAYRTPSTLALGGALLLMWLTVRKLIHAEAAWLAVFACLTLRGFNFEAADARPYALGTFVLCACIWLLVRWVESADWRYAAGFAIAAALLWRVHLLFWPCYAIFPIYVVAAIGGREARVRFWHAVVVFAAVGATLAPVGLRAVELSRDAQAHVVVPLPSARELGSALKVGMVAAAIVAALLFSRWRHWGTRDAIRGPSVLALVLAWWLAHAVGLFAYSWGSGISVFVPRYLFVALPGAAVATAAGVASFVPRQRLVCVSLAAGLWALLSMGQWNRLWPNHSNSDWRGAASALNGSGIAQDDPVIVPSPFVEARPPVWRPDYPISSFLYCPLTVYPVRGKPYPFPFGDSPEAQAFASRLSSEVLARSGRFAVYGWDRQVWFWRDWLRARPELSEWTVRSLGPFGDVDAVVFESSRTAVQP